MKLLIAVPALNEESSIASTIERCLDASEFITSSSPVTSVQITVVSDGSTDRTASIARRYADRIKLIEFEHNRGYGAAIAETWMQSDADLLGFLDADGTCDPRFFAPLCGRLIERNADIALGCRLNRQSRMPLLRRVGNRLFAWLLSVFSMKRVRDVASGMRIVRRSCLPRIFPLPTGLHFTPAMSARAMLSRNISIVELDMPYREREGRSKLKPFRDGVRFLRVILQNALLFRPSRPLGLVAAVLLGVTCLMMITPTLFYFRHGRLEEWMIYRFLVGELLATTSVLVWCTSYLGRKAADIALSDDPRGDRYHGVWGWLFSRRWVWLIPAGLVVIGAAFVWDALVNFLTTGRVYEHWSRFVTMMFFFSAAAIIAVTKCVDYCLNLLADRLAYVKATAERTGYIPH